MESPDKCFIKQTGKTLVGISGGGYSILEIFWLTAAIAELGVSVDVIQTVSSGALLGAKLIETNFNLIEINKILRKVIAGGPNVFKELYELINSVEMSIEYISKFNLDGLTFKGIKKLTNFKEYANLLEQMQRVKGLLKAYQKPYLLSHEPLERLIDEDLQIDFTKLVNPNLPELQIITRNETRCGPTIWSTRDPWVSPNILRDVMVGTMCLVPAVEHKIIFGEVHTDGQELILSEFIAEGYQTIIVFFGGQLARTLTEEIVSKQTILQRLISNFHTTINSRLVEELNYAHANGYKIFCNNPDSVISKIDNPDPRSDDPFNKSSKISHLPKYLKDIKRPEGIEKQHKKVILITPKYPMPNLGLLGFNKETMEKDFDIFGKKNLEDAKEFLTKALLT